MIRGNDRHPGISRQRAARAALLATGLFALAPLVLASPGCVGNIGDSDASGTGGPSTQSQVVGHSRFPRLSHRQWENTVQDLFHLSAPTGYSQAFYPDPLGGKAFDNNESVLDVTPQLWANYQTAAEKVATLVMDDPAALASILPSDLPTDPAARKIAFIKSFGLRAFRRPLTDDEVTALSAKFDTAPSLDTVHDPFTAGVGLVIETMLQSPFFLYRAELSSEPDPIDHFVHLTGYELASKLSYTLWNTMPDDALFDAAGAGDLDTVDGLDAKITEMLDDPRAQAALVSFHHQLYQADQYPQMTAKDATLFPDFDPAVAADMQTELDMFVKHVVVDQHGGLKELLTSTTTFVNLRLAQIYGLDTTGRTVDKFEQVELDPSQRSGLLTRAGFLAWKGRSTQPDTILRGVFINRLVLCQKLGDPPPEAAGAMLGDQPTDRERVETLTGKGTCGETCHGTYINPAGYALENFDAIGGYRTKDNGVSIDASATFPFDGKSTT
ncbi:MAG TPA: DUF1592 domain-containing protein, partial [Polyangiaceae bacterium]|nr:DUF1592 domain-containing protein [Polyangiaceae bacterium]